MRGRVEPRIWTRPLRPLSRKTSYGPECIWFAESVLGIRLLGWQKWWLLHALEKDVDGVSFRFRTVITLVGRQSGKTTLVQIVSSWLMFSGRIRLAVGSAQSLDVAREAWQGVVDFAQSDPELRQMVQAVRRANGEQCLTLHNGAKYRICAATPDAARGLSVDLLILDELRTHTAWAAWAALSKTTMARPHALTIGISNAGADNSVVLNALRETAIAGTDPTMAIFEWSAPDGCALDDPKMWAYGSPGLGETITEAAIRSALGTDPPAVFRTEVLCQRVEEMDQPVSPAVWASCADASGVLDRRRKVSLCLDVAPDSTHVTLAAAQTAPSGSVRVEVVGAWGSPELARAELPGLLAKIPYSRLGWYPRGPGSVLAADLHGVKRAESITADAVTVCMSFVEQVQSNGLRHPGDALLTAHVLGSSRKIVGDGYRFDRSGGNCDAAYAAAGAVHLERTAPASVGRPRLIVARAG